MTRQGKPHTWGQITIRLPRNLPGLELCLVSGTAALGLQAPSVFSCPGLASPKTQLQSQPVCLSLSLLPLSTALFPVQFPDPPPSCTKRPLQEGGDSFSCQGHVCASPPLACTPTVPITSFLLHLQEEMDCISEVKAPRETADSTQSGKKVKGLGKACFWGQSQLLMISS